MAADGSPRPEAPWRSRLSSHVLRVVLALLVVAGLGLVLLVGHPPTWVLGLMVGAVIGAAINLWRLAQFVRDRRRV